MKTQRRDPSIERLPVEIIERILGYLANAKALQAASFTCKKWYGIFKLRQCLLTVSVLVNCIGMDVLGEATLTYRCRPSFFAPSQQPANDSVGVPDIRRGFHLEDWLSSISLDGWAWRDIMEMCDFHENVIGPFVDLFVTYCSTYPCWGFNESLAKRPVSPSERQRIILALYRYDLYRELFSCAALRNVGRSESQLNFHFRYSTWENEQIYCIIDFLRRQLRTLSSIAEVNEDKTKAADWRIVEKRPTMLENRLREVEFKWWRDPVGMNGSTGPSQKQVEFLMAGGLAWIEDVVNAPSYETLSLQLETQVSCFDDTRHSYIGNFIDRLYRRNWRFQTRRLYNTRPRIDDGDTGPKQAWRLSKNSPRSISNDQKDWQRRRWGYVFWDEERLKMLSIMDL